MATVMKNPQRAGGPAGPHRDDSQLRHDRITAVVVLVINAATGGFGGKVAADLDHADKVRWGAFAYWITAVRELVDVQTLDIELSVDGHSDHLHVYGVAISNGRYVGGGFPIAPQAFLDDGLLDVTVIPVLPTLELLAAGVESMLGLSPDKHGVRSLRARRVSIAASSAMPFSLDGEATQEFSAEFEVVPGALRIVAAANAPGISQRNRARHPLLDVGVTGGPAEHGLNSPT